MKSLFAALGAGVFAVVVIVALWFGWVALLAWLGMLLMGAAHAQIAASIPAVSFWGAFVGVLLLSFVASFFRSASKTTS